MYEILQALNHLKELTGEEIELVMQNDVPEGEVVMLAGYAACWYEGVSLFTFLITPSGNTFMEEYNIFVSNHSV